MVNIVYQRDQEPEALLIRLRDLFSCDPLAVYDGPEELAARLGDSAWGVSVALEALEQDGRILV